MTGLELVQRWFREVWNEGDPGTQEAAIGRMFEPDAGSRGAWGLGPDPIDPQGFVGLHRRFRAAFDDIQIDVVGLEQGDRVAVQGAATMKFQGKTVYLRGSCLFRLDLGAEKIREAWNYWDFLGLMTDMGILGPGLMDVVLPPA